MRIALISDIHGNLISLETVLADIARQNVSQTICLGDVATLGPQPREVIARLRGLNCPMVMGNHDWFLVSPGTFRTYMRDQWFADTINWCMQKLAPEDIAYLSTFKPSLDIPLEDDGTLLCFHGSPLSNVDIILATTPNVDLDRMLGGRRTAVMAGGHTHVQMMRQYKGTVIVNVGSVGMPFEQMPFEHAPRIMPWAEYAIINWHDGQLGLELRRLPIDINIVKQAAIDNGLPDSGEWVRNWVTDWKYI